MQGMSCCRWVEDLGCAYASSWRLQLAAHLSAQRSHMNVSPPHGLGVSGLLWMTRNVFCYEKKKLYLKACN
jgi:hypothetical protein